MLVVGWTTNDIAALTVRDCCVVAPETLRDFAVTLSKKDKDFFYNNILLTVTTMQQRSVSGQLQANFPRGFLEIAETSILQLQHPSEAW